MPKATKNYNLHVINPSLAKEWHPTKNGDLTTKDVVPGAIQKVWWICFKGHEWKASINARNQGSGCPYCSGQKVCKDNCLEAVNPELAKQWHPIRNGTLTPRDVTSGSAMKVWWLCHKGHEWQAPIGQRSYGYGCPYCAGKAVCEDNCLQTVNPHLAQEWHPTLNGSLSPKDVLPNSSRKVWWICERKHEWKAQINTRNQGNGCPYCYRQPLIMILSEALRTPRKTRSGNILVEMTSYELVQLVKKVGINEDLSEEMKKFRKKHKLTQQQFSKKLGISRNTVSLIERGIGSNNMSLQLYRRIISMFFLPRK